MSKVSVQILSKGYRSHPGLVLDAVRFDVMAAEFVAIVGPSGSGKSTLLNIVSGLDTSFEGSCEVFDRPAGAHTTRLAYVFQEPRLMPWLTLVDNIRLVTGRKLSTERIIELLESVGLGEHAHNFPARLSGGMQRRASLARAFAVQPDLLLMDEPFVSLDLPTANRLRDCLLDLWSQRRPTVLFVTHDLREALMLADRVLFFSKGPAKIIHEYKSRLPRPRLYDEAAVRDEHDKLLEDFPKLLDGNAAQPGRAKRDNPLRQVG